MRTVSRLVLCWAVVATWLFWLADRFSVAADRVPTVTVMVEGADSVLKDLQFLASLVSPEEQAAWKKIIDKDEGILEIFLLGVDRTRPVQVDVLLDREGQRFRMFFPFDDFQSFVSDNLGGFEIEAKQIATDLYQLSGGGFEGYMRRVHGYAVIADKREDLPADLPNPTERLAHLLKAGYVVAAEIRNDAAGQADRQQAIQELRRNVLDAIKQKSNESEAQYRLRKAAVQSQLDEVERFFVEASRISVGLALDRDKKAARLDLVLEALPNTHLAKDIDLLNRNPARFFQVQKHSDAFLFVKVKFPLNEMRQSYLQAQLDGVRDVELEELAGEKDRTDEQKQKARQMIQLLHEIGTDLLKTGQWDGFLELRQNASSQRTLLAGLAVPEAKRLEQALQLYSESKSGRVVEMNVDEVGGLKVHKVQPSRNVPLLSEFWGEPSPVYVAVGEQEVWVATGADALSALKAAVTELQKAGEPTTPSSTDGEFVQFFVRCGPWLQFWDEQAAKQASAAKQARLSESEKAAREQAAKFRRLGIDACRTGDDTITGRLKRVGDRVEGEVEFGDALLKFVSKVVADFAKENL